MKNSNLQEVVIPQVCTERTSEFTPWKGARARCPLLSWGCSVRRFKARRWADADHGAGSSDDEPSPAVARPSFLDVACKAQPRSYLDAVLRHALPASTPPQHTQPSAVVQGRGGVDTGQQGLKGLNG